MTVIGSLNKEQIQRVRKGRGEHKSAGKGGVGGSGVMLEGIQEESRRRDFEGGRGGGVGVAWEGGVRVMRQELHTVLE